MKPIVKDIDTQYLILAKWEAIKAASQAYAYALPGGQWPNIKYNLPPGNNSATFIREMARVIGKNADIIGGPHPGADSPSPVSSSIDPSRVVRHP